MLQPRKVTRRKSIMTLITVLVASFCATGVHGQDKIRVGYGSSEHKLRSDMGGGRSALVSEKRHRCRSSLPRERARAHGIAHRRYCDGRHVGDDHGRAPLARRGSDTYRELFKFASVPLGRAAGDSNGCRSQGQARRGRGLWLRCASRGADHVGQARSQSRYRCDHAANRRRPDTPGGFA